MHITNSNLINNKKTQCSSHNLAVAIVTYNRPDFLKLMIDSVLHQSYTKFNLYIFDNGSDIKTRRIVEEFNCDKIAFVRNEINSLDYLNIPFTYCSEEFLVILHDDDILHPNFLEKEIQILSMNKQLSMVSTGIKYIDSQGLEIIGYDNPLKRDLTLRKMDFIKHFFFKGKLIIKCPTAMMRRQYFVENNLNFDFSAGPAADQYLWIRLNLLETEIHVLHEQLYYYRLHSSQESFLSKNMMIFLYKKLITFFNQKKLYNLKYKSSLYYLRNQLKETYRCTLSYNDYQEIVLEQLKEEYPKCKILKRFILKLIFIHCYKPLIYFKSIKRKII